MVVGPPPKKDKKKRKETEDAAAAPEEGEQQQQGADSISSSRSSSKQQAKGHQEKQPPAAAAPKAAKPSVTDGITFDPEAAAFELGASDSEVEVPEVDESGVFLLDEADDVEVEGDEPLDVYRARLKKELEAELLEIQEERKQRRQKQDAAAEAAAGTAGGVKDGSRRVRRSKAPVPKGTPQEAALLAMAAIEADEAAKKARARLPAELLGGGGSGGSSGSSRGGRKLRGSTRKPSKLR